MLTFRGKDAIWHWMGLRGFGKPIGDALFILEFCRDKPIGKKIEFCNWSGSTNHWNIVFIDFTDAKTTVREI